MVVKKIIGLIGIFSGRLLQNGQNCRKIGLIAVGLSQTAANIMLAGCDDGISDDRGQDRSDG